MDETLSTQNKQQFKASSMERKRRIRVLLADDHPVTLRGVRDYLRAKQHISVVGQALDGAEAFEKARKLLPDVILLDLRLPKMNGLEVTKKIVREIPGTRVLMFTVYDERAFVEESIRAGASGYVLKSSSPKELVRAIETVIAGRTFFSSAIPKPYLRSLSVNQTGKHYDAIPSSDHNQDELIFDLPLNLKQDLTRQERYVLRLVVEGLRTQRIAEELGISYHTVVSHLRHIYDKLHVHNRSTAVMKALRKHLV